MGSICGCIFRPIGVKDFPKSSFRIKLIESFMTNVFFPGSLLMFEVIKINVRKCA